ncbi:MAG: hypothetical protein RJA51_1749 [Actinomycetota bacterium]
MKYRPAWYGFTVWMISGWFTMCESPSSAIVANHTSITGPNTLPTAPVPRFCTMKRPVMMAMAMGTTHDSNDDETFSRPSTAESTEIAGVMTPSP